jgi:hypothetical protein
VREPAHKSRQINNLHGGIRCVLYKSLIVGPVQAHGPHWTMSATGSTQQLSVTTSTIGRDPLRSWIERATLETKELV